MKNYEIGGAGSTYEAEEIHVQSIGTETWKEKEREREHLQQLTMEGMIIFKWILNL